jgi:glycosyltransferase involved in cell wall biosynthesis
MRRGEDLARHFASADIFLFPSMTETFGNVTTEALASGLGVVAYDYAAAADLIRDGINGSSVPFGDAEAFAAAAETLAIGHGKQLRQVRANSAASVAHLDWEVIHDKFTHTLASVIASHENRGYDQLAPFAVAD